MKKSVKRLGIMLCIATLFLCSAAWGEELLKATVTGDNVNMRSAPNTKGKVLNSESSGAILFVDKKPVYDKEGKMNWYRVRYAYEAGMDGISFYDCTQYYHPNKLYISAKFVKTQPMSKNDLADVNSLKKSAAAANTNKKSGEWAVINLNELSDPGDYDSSNVITVVSGLNKNLKNAPVYAEYNLNSKVIGKLSFGTPLTLSECRHRRVNAEKREWWVKISKPIKGWLPIEFVSLWSTDFFAEL